MLLSWNLLKLVWLDSQTQTYTHLNAQWILSFQVCEVNPMQTCLKPAFSLMSSSGNSIGCNNKDWLYGVLIGKWPYLSNWFITTVYSFFMSLWCQSVVSSLLSYWMITAFCKLLSHKSKIDQPMVNITIIGFQWAAANFCDFLHGFGWNWNILYIRVDCEL